MNKQSTETSQIIPTERFEEVSGRSIFVLEAGSGSPAVFFEAGLGDFSRAWHLVQPEIAKHTKTFSYDRAGRGQSTWAGSNRTCNEIVDDLELLFEKLEVKTPLIFVAHSFGGFIARIFADRFPESLAGIVLVDSAQEDTVLLAPDIYRDMDLPPRRFDEPIWLTLSRHDRAMHLDPAFPNNLADASEGINLAECYKQVRASSHLNHIPLTVISAGRADLHRSYGATGAVAEAEVKWEKMWASCQTKLLELSPRSRHLIATESAHYVQRDQPELVIGAILDMVRRAEKDSSNQPLSI